MAKTCLSCIIKGMGKHFKLHMYAWIELLIWLLILSISVTGIKMYRYNKLKELKTYQVFMPDVDGMIIGSPVKLMGVQVGYVQNIKIVNNNVYVKFVITTPDVTIPQGSIATVEFNGLGGSKSLEIVQPTNETIASKQLIVINQPKRLHDSMLLLNDMFDKIDSIGAKFNHFTDKMGLINKGDNALLITPEEISKNIKQTDDFVDNMIKNREEFQNKLKGWKNE